MTKIVEMGPGMGEPLQCMVKLKGVSPSISSLFLPRGLIGCELVALSARRGFESSLCSIVECLAAMQYIRAVEQVATKATLLVHSHRAGSVSLLLYMGTRSSVG